MNFNMGFAKNAHARPNDSTSRRFSLQFVIVVFPDHSHLLFLGRQLSLGKQTDLILLEFSKAFDKVNHQKLLYKLSCFYVKGNTLNWIQSFLIGRTQTVVLDGESSEEVKVTSGVPQGSVLGPLLFLLYINDLPENIQSQVRLFADDTAVYLTVTNMQDSQVLQSDLESLQHWERTWDMEFNSGTHYPFKKPG